MFTKYFRLTFVLLAVSGCSTLNPPADEKVQPKVELSEKSEIKKMIAKEEKSKGIPNGILNSIAAVESHHDAYAVNTSLKSHRFKTKEEAVKFINTSLCKGCKNISVGCLQLHYGTHKRNFSSLNDMLTPRNNVAYAATLLKALYDKYGSWEMAIRKYHSGKSKYNKIYYTKVIRAYNSMYKSS